MQLAGYAKRCFGDVSGIFTVGDISIFPGASLRQQVHYLMFGTAEDKAQVARNLWRHSDRVL